MVGVLWRWRDETRRRRAAARLAEVRRAGHGLYVREWSHEQEDGHPLADLILAWCRETLGGCRRPWGIDHFDLALTCSVHDGGPARRLHLRRLRAADLYQPDGEAVRLRTQLAGIAERPGTLHVVAALFSWGDAAHAALPATA